VAQATTIASPESRLLSRLSFAALVRQWGPIFWATTSVVKPKGLHRGLEDKSASHTAAAGEGSTH